MDDFLMFWGVLFMSMTHLSVSKVSSNRQRCMPKNISITEAYMIFVLLVRVRRNKGSARTHQPFTPLKMTKLLITDGFLMHWNVFPAYDGQFVDTVETLRCAIDMKTHPKTSGNQP